MISQKAIVILHLIGASQVWAIPFTPKPTHCKNPQTPACALTSLHTFSQSLNKPRRVTSFSHSMPKACFLHRIHCHIEETQTAQQQNVYPQRICIRSPLHVPPLWIHETDQWLLQRQLKHPAHGFYHKAYPLHHPKNVSATQTGCKDNAEQPLPHTSQPTGDVNSSHVQLGLISLGVTAAISLGWGIHHLWSHHSHRAAPNRV